MTYYLFFRTNLTRHFTTSKCGRQQTSGPSKTTKKLPTRTSQRFSDENSLFPDVAGLMCEICGEECLSMAALKR